MLLKDHAALFVRKPAATDPYGTEFTRYDCSRVMVFEKQAAGKDGRDAGSCVIYYFPERSTVTGGKFPEIHPGDYCAAGSWGRQFDPMTHEAARRIVSVEKRFAGSARTRHIVIEAV